MIEELSSPLYQLPLTDEQLALVGRITLMWGQVDFQLDGILRALHGLDDEQFALFFGSTVVSRKVDQARRSKSRTPAGPTREALDEACDAVRDCVADRNLVTHAFWGWLWDKAANEWRGAAIGHRKREFFGADRLPELHERLINATIKVDRASSLLLHKQEPPPNRNRMFAASPFPPEDAPGGPPPRFAR